MSLSFSCFMIAHTAMLLSHASDCGSTSFCGWLAFLDGCFVCGSVSCCCPLFCCGLETFLGLAGGGGGGLAASCLALQAAFNTG